MYMCVRGIYSASISKIFGLNFGTILMVWYFFCFSFYQIKIYLFNNIYIILLYRKKFHDILYYNITI
jgi:hypothetical protein